MNVKQNEIIAEQAHQVFVNLKETLRQQGFLFLKVGHTLKIIRDDKIYKYLDYETFEHFINDSDIGLKRPTAYLYIRIYEYFIEQLGFSQEYISEVQISRLMRALPKLKQLDDGKAKEIVEKLAVQTTWDYEKTIQEEHLEVDRPKLYKDKETGKWIFLFEPEQIERIVNLKTKETIYGTIIPIE